MAALSSKEAQAALIDPFNAPEPSEESGLNSHFGSTFAGLPKAAATTTSPKQPTTTTTQTSSPRSPALGSRNPFRDGSTGGSPTGARAGASPVEKFPNYRAEAFGDYPPARRTSNPHRNGGAPPPPYEDAKAGASGSGGHRRRGSSLRERYPGDDSHKPLEVIRRASKKADRSPHLNKRHIPGADVIDRLDPALGGVAYHHEGPYDAASLARNTSRNPNRNPIDALETTNAEALKATPKENVRDALERHKPLDGVAIVPPGMPDQFGRTYDYEEGTEMNREGGGDDAGYKRWPGKTYDPEDLKGQSEPTFSLDRAFKAHKIDENGGIEMQDREDLMKDYKKKERKGTLDNRDPVEIAGGDSQYVDAELRNYGKDADWGAPRRSSSLRQGVDGLKKRIGSLRHKKGQSSKDLDE